MDSNRRRDDQELKVRSRVGNDRKDGGGKKEGDGWRTAIGNKMLWVWLCCMGSLELCNPSSNSVCLFLTHNRHTQTHTHLTSFLHIKSDVQGHRHFWGFILGHGEQRWRVCVRSHERAIVFVCFYSPLNLLSVQYNILAHLASSYWSIIFHMLYLLISLSLNVDLK